MAFRVKYLRIQLLPFHAISAMSVCLILVPFILQQQTTHIHTHVERKDRAIFKQAFFRHFPPLLVLLFLLFSYSLFSSKFLSLFSSSLVPLPSIHCYLIPFSILGSVPWPYHISSLLWPNFFYPFFFLFLFFLFFLFLSFLHYVPLPSIPVPILFPFLLLQINFVLLLSTFSPPLSLFPQYSFDC